MADKLLDRLSKILNQAENASTEEEANAFLAKAQELSTLHSIELATARARATEMQNQRVEPVRRRVPIGEKGVPNRKSLADLFVELCEANDVKWVISLDGHWVEAVGFPQDIDVVEALFAVISVQMVEAGTHYHHSGAYKTESPGTHWATAKASFYRGYTERVSERLRQAKWDAERGASRSSSGGSELVLRDKRQQVGDAYRDVARDLGVRSYYSGRRLNSDGASSRAGRKAGATARLGGERAISNDRARLH